MNDIELNEVLDKWTAPPVPPSLRTGVSAGFDAGVGRRAWRWSWGKTVLAGAALALGLIVTAAVPQTLDQTHRPYAVVSEFLRYADDGTPSVEMYEVSYNDQYGREIMLSRHIPDHPLEDLAARMMDAAARGTGPVRMLLLRVSRPDVVAMIAKRAELGPIPAVTTECTGPACLSVAQYFLPKAAGNPAMGCMEGEAVDRETILEYATVAMQLPLDGNRRRRTVWMAPALGCFALKITTEEQRADGSFRLESGKQAVKVRLNP